VVGAELREVQDLGVLAGQPLQEGHHLVAVVLQGLRRAGVDLFLGPKPLPCVPEAVVGVPAEPPGSTLRAGEAMVTTSI
jgi:hypothetical protein